MNQTPNLEDLYKYFEQSMKYLMKEGKLFADRYPDVARTLQMDGSDIKDPDVRRLVETFALFDARLNWTIEQEKERLPNTILSTVLPETLRDKPVATVIEVSTTQSSSSTVIPRFAEVHIQTYSGANCIFRTAIEHEVIRGAIISTSMIQLNQHQALAYIKCQSGLLVKMRLSQPSQNIRIYINAERNFASTLLKGIISSGLIIDYETGKNVGLVRECEDYGNFYESHTIGYPYSQIYDYSILPNKFYFLDLVFSDVSPHAKKEFSVVLPLHDSINKLPDHMHDRLLLLNCIPVVNLFPKKAEPVLIQNNQTEHKVIIDINSDLYQLHTVTNVSIYKPSSNVVIHELSKDYFIDYGTDTYISLVDKSGQNDGATMYIDTLCTNGHNACDIMMNNAVMIYNYNYIQGKALITPDRPSIQSHETKWLILAMHTTNQFQVLHKQNRLLEIIACVSRMYWLTHGFVSVTSRKAAGLSRVDSAWNSMVIKTIFEIYLNPDKADAFILAILWGRILQDMAEISNQTEVYIYQDGRQLYHMI